MCSSSLFQTIGSKLQPKLSHLNASAGLFHYPRKPEKYVPDTVLLNTHLVFTDAFMFFSVK